MPDEKKEVPVTDGERGDAEYREEFEKLAAGGEPTKEPKADEKKPEPPKEEPLPDEEKEPPAAAEKEPSGEGETEDGDIPADKEAPKGDDAGLAKALKDTKAWATKLAMEKKALEKELSDLKVSGAPKEKIEKAKESAGETRKVLEEKIKKASEDYPELKETLDLLANLSLEGLSKAKDFEKITEAETKRQEARQHFEAEVEPEIIKVHPDFRKVAFSKEYMAWVEKQSPATQYAAMNSLDPEDINGTLTKYKKSLAGGDAEKAKAETEKRKQGLKDNLSSLRGGGSVSKKGNPAKLEDIDPNDHAGAFAFLAAQEEAAKKAAK